MVVMLRTAFPDLRYEANEVIVEGGLGCGADDPIQDTYRPVLRHCSDQSPDGVGTDPSDPLCCCESIGASRRSGRPWAAARFGSVPCRP